MSFNFVNLTFLFIILGIHKARLSPLNFEGTSKASSNVEIQVEQKSRVESFNSILDTESDFASTSEFYSYWAISNRSCHSQVFKYYDNAQEIPGHDSCARKLSYKIMEKISDSHGLWVSCAYHEHCKYPSIKFWTKSFEIQKLKIKLNLVGEASVRISVKNDCFDFGFWKNKYSACKFMELAKEKDGWSTIFFQLPYKQQSDSFSLELITALEFDVIVIDTIEATSDFPNEDSKQEMKFKDITRETIFQEEVNFTPIIGYRLDDANYTLDIIEDANIPPPASTVWTTPRNFKRYWEYYNDTSELQSSSQDPGSCAHYIRQDAISRLPHMNGLFIACQDPSLPPECESIPASPCNAFVKFYHPTSGVLPFRTIKITFHLEGLAILRLSFDNNDCYDYSKRKDVLSQCHFIKIEEETGQDGLSRILFSYYPDALGYFQKFSLDLVTRFQHDIIIIDKVEVTRAQLCGWHEACPTPKAIPAPTITVNT